MKKSNKKPYRYTDDSDFDVEHPEKKRRQSYVKSENAFCKGVYFLHRNGQIVYVGMSTVNCMERVLIHYNSGKDFDSFSIRRLAFLSEKQLRLYERFLIEKFKPEYNTIHNSPWKEGWKVECKN